MASIANILMVDVHSRRIVCVSIENQPPSVLLAGSLHRAGPRINDHAPRTLIINLSVCFNCLFNLKTVTLTGLEWIKKPVIRVHDLVSVCFIQRAHTLLWTGLNTH